MQKISVIIIDNHPVVRQGLSTVLGNQQNMEVVGESGATTSALPMIKDNKPDVAIIDGSMTDVCGADFIPKIKTLSKDTSIIIYSTHQKHEPIFRAFKAGAKGYVLKADEISEVIDAIDEVQQGNLFISQKIPNAITNQLLNGGGENGSLSCLSPREYEIAKLLSQCMTPHDIGAMLFISPRTVRVHRSNIMSKLNCKKAVELLVLLRDYFSH